VGHAIFTTFKKLKKLRKRVAFLVKKMQKYFKEDENLEEEIQKEEQTEEIEKNVTITKLSHFVKGIEELIKMHGTEEDLKFIRTFQASIPKKYEDLGAFALSYIIRIFNDRTFLAHFTFYQYIYVVPKVILDFVRSMHLEILNSWIEKDNDGFIKNKDDAYKVIGETRPIITTGCVIIQMLFTRILFGKDRSLKELEIQMSRPVLENKIQR